MATSEQNSAPPDPRHYSTPSIQPSRAETTYSISHGDTNRPSYDSQHPSPDTGAEHLSLTAMSAHHSPDQDLFPISRRRYTPLKFPVSPDISPEVGRGSFFSVPASSSEDDSEDGPRTPTCKVVFPGSAKPRAVPDSTPWNNKNIRVANPRTTKIAGTQTVEGNPVFATPLPPERPTEPQPEDSRLSPKKIPVEETAPPSQSKPKRLAEQSPEDSGITPKKIRGDPGVKSKQRNIFGTPSTPKRRTSGRLQPPPPSHTSLKASLPGTTGQPPDSPSTMRIRRTPHKQPGSLAYGGIGPPPTRPTMRPTTTPGTKIRVRRKALEDFDENPLPPRYTPSKPLSTKRVPKPTPTPPAKERTPRASGTKRPASPTPTVDRRSTKKPSKHRIPKITLTSPSSTTSDAPPPPPFIKSPAKLVPRISLPPGVGLRSETRYSHDPFDPDAEPERQPIPSKLKHWEPDTYFDRLTRRHTIFTPPEMIPEIYGANWRPETGVRAPQSTPRSGATLGSTRAKDNGLWIDSIPSEMGNGRGMTKNSVGSWKPVDFPVRSEGGVWRGKEIEGESWFERKDREEREAMMSEERKKGTTELVLKQREEQERWQREKWAEERRMEEEEEQERQERRAQIERDTPTKPTLLQSIEKSTPVKKPWDKQPYNGMPKDTAEIPENFTPESEWISLETRKRLMQERERTARRWEERTARMRLDKREFGRTRDSPPSDLNVAPWMDGDWDGSVSGDAGNDAESEVEGDVGRAGPEKVGEGDLEYTDEAPCVKNVPGAATLAVPGAQNPGEDYVFGAKDIHPRSKATRRSGQRRPLASSKPSNPNSLVAPISTGLPPMRAVEVDGRPTRRLPQAQIQAPSPPRRGSLPVRVRGYPPAATTAVSKPNQPASRVRTFQRTRERPPAGADLPSGNPGNPTSQYPEATQNLLAPVGQDLGNQAARNPADTQNLLVAPQQDPQFSSSQQHPSAVTTDQIVPRTQVQQQTRHQPSGSLEFSNSGTAQQHPYPAAIQPNPSRTQPIRKASVGTQTNTQSLLSIPRNGNGYSWVRYLYNERVYFVLFCGIMLYKNPGMLGETVESAIQKAVEGYQYCSESVSRLLESTEEQASKIASATVNGVVYVIPEQIKLGASKVGSGINAGGRSVVVWMGYSFPTFLLPMEAEEIAALQAPFFAEAGKSQESSGSSFFGGSESPESTSPTETEASSPEDTSENTWMPDALHWPMSSKEDTSEGGMFSNPFKSDETTTEDAREGGMFSNPFKSDETDTNKKSWFSNPLSWPKLSPDDAPPSKTESGTTSWTSGWQRKWEDLLK